MTDLLQQIADLRAVCEKAPRNLSPVCQAMTGHWMVGEIRNHSANPTYELDTIEAVCQARTALPRALEALEVFIRDALNRRVMNGYPEGSPGWIATDDLFTRAAALLKGQP